MMKDNEKNFRRQLIFDIDTKIAEQILGSSYRSIYKDIRDYLAKKDFEHIEGSGYISKKTLSDTQIFRVVNALKK